ncbi:MAG: PDZ domain-containing protein [Verrucomicrobiota bacterium]
MKSLARVFLLIGMPLLWISCIGPDFQSSFDSTYPTLAGPEKDPSKVEVLHQKPFRSVVYLGEIRIDSTRSKPLSLSQFIQEAQKKSAKIGADFVEVLKTDLTANHSTQAPNTPGTQIPETYVTLNPRLSLNEMAVTAVIAKAGRYCPTKLGLIYDESYLPRYVIRAFDDQSRAIRAGLKIGDEVILIDSLRLDDPRLAEKSMIAKPGDEAKISILRNNQQRQFILPRIANR